MFHSFQVLTTMSLVKFQLKTLQLKTTRSSQTMHPMQRTKRHCSSHAKAWNLHQAKVKFPSQFYSTSTVKSWHFHPFIADTLEHRFQKQSEDIINSEIRRRDRRTVRPEHLLFANKKSHCKQLCSSINIALKKTQANGMTASQALDRTFVNDAVSKDNAYRFMANITGSPPYWEQQKKNVLAMVRQLGIFTFFITMSAAETHWPELLKILKKTVDNEEDADVSNLDFQEKARLIRSDPVTCALYFDHRFKEVKKTWMNGKEGPFGNYKISHIYYRIEFQHRGSPHVHMVVWLENAPIYDPEDEASHQQVTDFIDGIISTTSVHPLVEKVETFQFHK